MILEGAEPFLLLGERVGVLLVHGFTGVPAEMRPLGQALHKEGFTVLGVRLSGHATTPEDLARMTEEDWMDSVRDGYALLSCLVDRVAVVGHSMGALCALRLAAEKKVAAVCALAAPIYITSYPLEALPSRADSAGKFYPKPKRKIPNVPAAANRTYRKMPLISVHELLDGIERTKDALGAIAAPLLVLHGREDHTAAPRSAHYIYDNVKSSERELIFLEEAGHRIQLGEKREEVFAEVIRFFHEIL